MSGRVMQPKLVNKVMSRTTAENIALQQLLQQRLGDRLANETSSLPLASAFWM